MSLFLILLAFHYMSQLELTKQGRPYETWDEIATWNTSHVINPGAGKIRVYEYGSIETFQQLLANIYYEHFDSIGKNLPRFVYSNNIPETFTNQRWAYALHTIIRPDYDHFRGANDRQSIFVSRQIHVTYICILTLILAQVLIHVFSIYSIPALVSLLLIISAPEMAYQSYHSLPSAGSSMAVLLAFVFSSLSIYLDSFIYVALSMFFFAVALHTKIDAVSFAPSLGLGIIIFLRQAFKKKGIQETKKIFSRLCLVFFASLLFLKPGMFFKPFGSVMIQIHELSGFAGKPNVPENIERFFNFFRLNFLSLGDNRLEMFAILIVFLVMFAAYTISGTRRVGMVYIAAIVINWGAIIFKSSGSQTRYFISGVTLLYVFVGLGLTFLWIHEKNKKLKWLPLLISILGLFLFSWRMIAETALANELHESYKIFDGNDPLHSRNKAIDFIIKNFHSSDTSNKILVDLHGYIDIRRLIENNFEVGYINFSNFETVFKNLSKDQKHLVIFVPGTYTADEGWGKWTNEEMNRYDRYLKALSQFKTIYEVKGEPMQLLNPAPPFPNNEILVKVIE